MKPLPPIPERMLHLDRDRRGYPIPFVVYRDTTGTAHFTINDHFKVDRAAEFRLCAICGDHLGAHKWFVGGPASAFHPNGRYLDGPMHRDCGRFALEVCPFLALAGRYTGRIDAATLRAEDAHPGMGLIDHTQHPTQPVVFVFADTSAYARTATGLYDPVRPWRAVEFWRGGAQVDPGEARALVEAAPDPARPFHELRWP
jgi:hypothetical protein